VPAPMAPSASTPARPAARPSREPPPAVDSLRAESQLLGEAHRAMNDGDGARALRLLDAYRQRFPRGVLREEHAVARVLALCQAGRRAEARGPVDFVRGARPRGNSPRAPHDATPRLAPPRARYHACRSADPALRIPHASAGSAPTAPRLCGET